MAWLTKIIAMEQVDYRLKEHAGCYVAPADGTAPAPAPDVTVDYRLRTDHPDGTLVWMGSGLQPFGLRPGQVLDDAGKDAARALMNGTDPVTGTRLVPAEVRAHDKAQLVAARLLEAMREEAARRGLEDPADLLAGKPKQQRQFAALARQVHKSGDAYRLQYDTLHRLARAAGIDLDQAYPTAELADARAHQHDRVNVRVRGWDLVADLPKSLSTLHGLMDEEDARDLRRLVHRAKDEAFAQLEEWVGYAVTSLDGHPARIATGGLTAWSVEHHAARPVDDDTPGDPHLHLHVVIANLARCTDGRWRSIANSGRDLHRHAKAFDALFKARVRALTGERFGMRYVQDPDTGAWEVEGVPSGLREVFSRRAAQVEAVAGAEASRADKLHASQRTRHAKHDTDTVDLRGSWNERARQAGYDPQAVVAAAASGRAARATSTQATPTAWGSPSIPTAEDLAAVVFDPETGLTSNDKEFSRAQMLATLAHALPYGIAPGVGRLDALADRVVQVPGQAVPLPHRGSQVMSNTDRHTTSDILRAEQAITAQARARYADGSAQLTAGQAESAIGLFELASGYGLSDEQRDVVTRVLTAGHGVDAVIGVAGAGKTTLMDACRIGWDATGLVHAGAALSAVAAQNLQEEAGIPARTIASWLLRIRDGEGLAGVDVLVVDEAAMTDDRAMAVLLTEAARTRTKVVAIGDPLQLQAVGPGGGFAEVHRLVGGATLTENRRQRHEAERAALRTWRTGNHRMALDALADAGRVHATDSADDARAQIIASWNRLRAQWPDPHGLLAHLAVLAPRNHDVDLLNSQAQAHRRAAGELGPEHTYALPAGRRLTLAVGDLVRVRANDYRSRRGEGPDILNGRRAVITALDEHNRVRITWRRHSPDGPAALTSAWLTPEQIVAGSLSLGYAMTVAASQGLTTTHSLTYGHGANPDALYAALTRARTANHLWLPTAALEPPETRARLGEPRTESEVLTRGLDAFTQLLQQSRPDAMISNELRPAPSPAVPHWHSRPYGHLTDPALATRLAQAAEAAHRWDEQTADLARRREAADPATAVAIASDQQHARAQAAKARTALAGLRDEQALRKRIQKADPALHAAETAARAASGRMSTTVRRQPMALANPSQHSARNQGPRVL
jgi:conjugative relaxase-like TrwC/TraI family protein